MSKRRHHEEINNNPEEVPTKIENPKKPTEENPEDVVRARIQSESQNNPEEVKLLIRESESATYPAVYGLIKEVDFFDGEEVGADFVKKTKVEAYRAAIDREFAKAVKTPERRGIRVSVNGQDSIFEDQDAIDAFVEKIKERLELQVEIAWTTMEFGIAYADNYPRGNFRKLKEKADKIEEDKQVAKEKLEATLLLQAELSEQTNEPIKVNPYTREGKVTIAPSRDYQAQSAILIRRNELEREVRKIQEEIYYNRGQSRGLLGFKGRKIDREQATRAKWLADKQKLLDVENGKIKKDEVAEKLIEKLSDSGLLDFKEVFSDEADFARRLAEDKTLTVGKLLGDLRTQCEQIGQSTLTAEEKQILAILGPLSKSLNKKVDQLNDVMATGPAQRWY